MAKTGYVYLVGAGPGDQKLITVKGLEALRKAEVVLYDRLVNPLLLQEIDAKAEIIYCGKLPDRHILRQESINELLVKKAKEGKLVVRLKGGDPSVFGRVGEEAEALKQEQIAYEIVPGITSGIAAATYAGIPVTHREYGTSFTVVTGHDKSVEGKPLINWQVLATGIDTIAFYMGVKNLPYICENLVANGRDAQTKVAVIQWGTTGKQRVVEGTLETIVNVVQKHHISNPAITLIGNVVSLRQQLKWFEDKPFFGKRVLFPNGTPALTEALNTNGVEVLVYPKQTSERLINEATYLNKLENISNFKALLFTSKESVELFFESLLVNKIDIRSLQAKIYCVDDETSDALLSRGLLTETATEMNDCLVIGANEAIQNFKGEYLVTHRLHNSYPASIAFQRVVEEGGFTTIIFSSAFSVTNFLEQAQRDERDPYEIIRSSEIICIGEAAYQACINNQITINKYHQSMPTENLTQLL